ncbi:MAG: helix-hairpin-helix domain-containing protein [Chloroflexota bacterium]
MGILPIFIIGVVTGGTTWELYKRRDVLRRESFSFDQLKNKTTSLFRREQAPEVSEEEEEIPVIQLDRLEALHGIGPVYARRLNEAGILTYADLAQTSPERLTTIVSPDGNLSPNVEAWIAEANQLLEARS